MKYTGVLIAVLITIISNASLNAQNLVLNPSFEDTVFCPTDFNMYPFSGIDQVSGAQYWNSANLNPDYFNCTIDTGFNGVVQNAIDGTAKMALSTYALPSSFSTTEILIGQLSQNLNVGQEYYVSFKVKPSTKQCFATNNLGILFTNQFYNSNSLPFNNTNFAHINSATIISDTTNWTTIHGTFTADSTYNYLLIGNLFNAASTDTVTPWDNKCLGIDNNFSYYFIDDICVSEDSLDCNLTVGIPQVKIKNEVLIYPNPTFNHLTITNFQSTISKITILDITGKTYKTITNNINVVDVSDLPSGIFFIELTTVKGIITRKFIKQ
jgi:hypothetical protein